MDKWKEGAEEMNSFQLKTFCSVARTLSFTASAAELMISQPAVSRQIANLEEEIGAKLFIREHNTLTLTAAGMQLYEELPGKLEELDALFFSVHLLGIGKKRKLKLGVLRNQILGAKLIDVLRSMRDENYYVTIQEYDFETLEGAVRNQDIDVAVSIKWVPTAFQGCACVEIRKEALCLAVNRDYAPQIPEILTRESLEPFSKLRPVMIPKTSSFPKSQLGAVAERMSHFWNGVMEENVDSIVPMVQTGIGSALVNEQHVLSREDSVEMIPLEFLEAVPSGLFWLDGRQNESIEDFVRRMKA